MRWSNRIILWNLWNFLVVLISSRFKFDFSFKLCEICIWNMNECTYSVDADIKKEILYAYRSNGWVALYSTINTFSIWIFHFVYSSSLGSINYYHPKAKEPIFIDQFMRTDKISVIHGKAERLISATSPMVTD